MSSSQAGALPLVPMKLELDPAFLRTSMELWRDAVDMKIPVHDTFKVHFLERRGQLLQGFSRTGANWLMVLDACKAEGDDLAELAALKAQVKDFKQWADEGLEELRTLALRESLSDNIQQMLADPELGEAVRRLLGPPDSGPGTPGR